MPEVKRLKTLVKSLALGAVFTAAASTGVVNAAEPDWSSIESQKVTLFYPGVASWELMTRKDHGTGMKPTQKGKKSCEKCHVNKKGEYDIAADKIVAGKLTMSDSGGVYEPNPRTDLTGYMDVQFQAAYDAENVYMKVTWPSAGTSFSDASIAEAGKADRVSIQLADKKVKTFAKFGCYVTCHDDMKDMPEDKGRKLYADFSAKKGKALPQAMLDKLIDKGQIIDQWVAAFHGSEIKLTDEYIASDRQDDNMDISATGGFADGNYSVVFTRPLNTGDKGDVAIPAKGTVSVSIAIHEKNSDSRVHYTSFPVSIGINAKKADVVATKL